MNSLTVATRKSSASFSTADDRRATTHPRFTDRILANEINIESVDDVIPKLMDVKLNRRPGKVKMVALALLEPVTVLDNHMTRKCSP